MPALPLERSPTSGSIAVGPPCILLSENQRWGVYMRYLLPACLLSFGATPEQDFNLAASRNDFLRVCETERAFKWLDVAYQERDLGLPSLKTDFLLDSLRTDLRLTELVKRVGLP